MNCTPGALVFQRPQNHGINAATHGRFLRRRGKTPDRKFAREHFVKRDAKAEDVGAMVHTRRLLDLLRGHGRSCAEFRAVLREQRFRSTIVDPFRKAKVRDFTRLFASSRMFSGLMSRWSHPVHARLGARRIYRGQLSTPARA
jgi:hypothetical protein